MWSIILFIAFLSTAIAVPRPENPASAGSTVDQSLREAPLSGKFVDTNVVGLRARDVAESTDPDFGPGDAEIDYNDDPSTEVPPDGTQQQSTEISMADTGSGSGSTEGTIDTISEPGSSLVSDASISDNSVNSLKAIIIAQTKYVLKSFAFLHNQSSTNP